MSKTSKSADGKGGLSSAAASAGALIAASPDLGAEAAGVLAAPDLGEAIQAGLGIDIGAVEASELTLVSLLIDDSGSITNGASRDASGNLVHADLSQEVRDGHNEAIDALAGSKQKDAIIVHCRYLNGTVLYPFARLDDAVKMTAKNYQATGGTPLYDETVALLGTVVAKIQEAEAYGVAARSVTVIITDGQDVGSRNASAADVKAVISDLIKTENHMIIGVGIGDEADFRRVFNRMGIPNKWIHTSAADKRSLRATFRMVSQSALRASQAAGPMSAVTLGGFGG